VSSVVQHASSEALYTSGAIKDFEMQNQYYGSALWLALCPARWDCTALGSPSKVVLTRVASMFVCSVQGSRPAYRIRVGYG